jgi:hypothetical protein
MADFHEKRTTIRSRICACPFGNYSPAPVQLGNTAQLPQRLWIFAIFAENVRTLAYTLGIKAIEKPALSVKIVWRRLHGRSWRTTGIPDCRDCVVAAGRPAFRLRVNGAGRTPQKFTHRCVRRHTVARRRIARYSPRTIHNSSI